MATSLGSNYCINIYAISYYKFSQIPIAIYLNNDLTKVVTYSASIPTTIPKRTSIFTITLVL